MVVVAEQVCSYVTGISDGQMYGILAIVVMEVKAVAVETTSVETTTEDVDTMVTVVTYTL